MGIALIGVAIVAAVFFWGMIVPFLVMVLQNTLLLIVMCAVLVFLWLNHRTIYLLFQMVSTRLAQALINSDPITVMRVHITSMNKRLDYLVTSLSELRGQKQKMSQYVQQRLANKDKFLKEAQSYQKHEGSKYDIELAANKAAMEAESAQSLMANLTRIEKAYEKIVELKEKASYVRDYTVHLVDLKQADYEAVRTSHGALRTAMDIIKGNTNERLEFETAMQAVADQTAMRIGEMDNLMEMSKGILSGIDAERGILTDKGLEMLATLETGCSTMISAVPSQGVKPSGIVIPSVTTPLTKTSASLGKYLG
jgi:hypothetical protein